MSKKSKKQQASTGKDNDHPAKPARTVPMIIAGAAIVCLIIAGAWLLTAQHVTPGSIVGTWTDSNNYYAYAYYCNGSILELGWVTDHTGGGATHIPVYMTGTWADMGNNHYLLNPNVEQNATYEAVIDGTTMSVLNMSKGGDTRKISDEPNVNLVKFNYAL